jgi:hypothetical protein
MDGEREAPVKEPALQPLTKDNSKEGVDEGGHIHGPKTGPTGYVLPLNAVGNTGDRRLTRSKANKYDIWPGLGDERAPRTQSTPATRSTVKTQQEVLDDQCGEEEFDSTDSLEGQHSVKQEQSGKASHKEEDLDEAKFRESPPIEYTDFPPPLLTSTLLEKVKDAEGVLAAALAIWEARAKRKGVLPSNLDHDPLALNEPRLGASGKHGNGIKREDKPVESARIPPAPQQSRTPLNASNNASVIGSSCATTM